MRQGRYYRLAVVLGVAGLLAHCTSDSDDSSSSDSESDKLQLALEEATVAQSLDFADQTLSTMDQALEETAGAIVVELIEEDSEYASRWCSDSGEPMFDPDDSFTSLALDDFSPASDGGLSTGHPNYPARRFHCQLKVNSESPETIRGAYSTVKGILCAAESAGGIDWDNPGATDVTFAFSSDCFGEKMLSEMGDGTEVNVTVTTEVLGDDPNWDKSVSLSNLQFGDNAVDEDGLYYFAFRNSKEGLAVKHYEISSENPNNYSGWSFTLDSDGELRFERKSFDAYDADADATEAYGSDFVRLYASGTILIETDDDGNTTSKFDSVDTFEGIYSRMYPHPDETTADAGEVVTIKGTSELGFKTRAYSCNSAVSDGDEYSCAGEDASTYEDHSTANEELGYSNCYPEEKGCDGIEPLAFSDGDEAVVMRVDSVGSLEKSPRDWIINMEAPLSYEAVTFDYIQE